MSAHEHFDAVLTAVGFDQDPECQGTSARFLSFLREFTPNQPPPAVECCAFTGVDPVVLKGVPFHSLCAHHLLPFFGEADIAYLPDGRIAGIGNLARVLRHFARQPQVQERLTAQIADYLHAALGGAVVVRLRARQLCMEMRGAESTGLMETRAGRGADAERLWKLLP